MLPEKKTHRTVDASREPTERSNMSNDTQMTAMGHKDGTSTYLGPGYWSHEMRDAKHGVNEMDSIGSHTNALSTCTEACSIENDVE